MALDSLAGEPAPSQHRVAIHERGEGLVEQYHGLLVDVDDCHSESAWTTFAGGRRAPGPRKWAVTSSQAGDGRGHLTEYTSHVK
jgi:hypothetical protein